MKRLKGCAVTSTWSSREVQDAVRRFEGASEQLVYEAANVESQLL